jgi:hypothetical protein
MTDHTHQTAPTQFADGDGIRFAYRRFGKNQVILRSSFAGTSPGLWTIGTRP